MPAKPLECRAHVVVVRALAPQIIEVDLAMDDPPALEFEAGQWISVPFGPKNVRAYSIASTPDSPDVVTLCADVAPGGIGSQWFRELCPGSIVEFKAPFGGFVFSREDPRRALFVAEEIGIVPIYAMLAELDHTEPGRPATLIHGGRDPEWLPYLDAFSARAEANPAFTYRPVVESAPLEWSGERGSLVEVVGRGVTTVENLVVYVSGGGEMIRRLREILTARGLARRDYRWEKFW